MWRPFVFISLMLLMVTRGAAQLPACSDRPTYISQPWINPELACLEEVINDATVGTLGFAALAVAPDETLYATRPLTGEVVALTDTNGDLLPDTPQARGERPDTANRPNLSRRRALHRGRRAYLSLDRR
ncbi:MAG: hypothetical protein IPK17_24055 [Chloroflexi bacterium]|uniref:hypothetical protein n=1 Tax=Candidatus Flexifilum breve TaxID=3140694 RepID=UPI0031370CD6|nr:hypothetical protein [Chloroflexota bacterium]